MKRVLSALSSLVVLAGLSACGGGGGGGNGPEVSVSPYTGLTTPAVVTAANADNIARQAFQGADLGANATLSPVRSGGLRTAAQAPMALTLVRLLSGVANATFSGPVAVRAPEPRRTETGREYDALGTGWADYTLDINDQSGQFTGTFVFSNYHGDGGGVINGPVAVSGVVTQFSMQILFDFQSVRFVDGAEDVTAIGTVNLVSGSGGGSAALDIVFRDNATRKTVWLSNFTVAVADLTGATDVRMFGRIYLHDYGYVDVWTEAGFVYPTGSTLPTTGAMTLTGKDNTGVRMTVNSQTQYTLDVDSDGDGAYDDLTVSLTW